MKPSRFFDPLYGRIAFDEWEGKLVFAPEVQRLRFVRMCNINSLLVSGASEISRFEHVIGVFHLARQWTKINGVVGDQAKIVHAAAILHDVQTGPFGHSLEYILNDNQVPGQFRHDDLSHGAEHLHLQLTNANVAFAGARFSSRQYLDDLWPRVAEAISGRGPFGPLISGRIDIDNIDNVVRLAYHAGIADRSDANVCLELASDIKLANSVVSISRNGLESLYRWQEIRGQLYNLLLHDWAEFSAKAMLTTMMELAVKDELLGADSWMLTDDGLLNVLTRETVGESQQIGELARRLMLGDLYAPLALWRSKKIDAYDRISKAPFKRALERRFMELLRTRCIFHVILDSGKTERKLKLLLRDDGRMHEFGRDAREILVGFFLSRTDQSTSLRTKAIAELRSFLADECGELVALHDPIPSDHSDVTPEQLSLL